MRLAKPTAQQLEWAKQEIGVIIHYDIEVFEPSYQFRKCWGYQPGVQVFNPKALNTDQWLETCKAMGAKYAILVAKHCTGFSLWDTKAHDYNSVKSPYGKDIVAQFIESCKKYGIKPGLYYSTVCNAYCNVDNPGTERSGNKEAQERYNQVVLTQLEELWGNYGELFEVWFDGGILPEKKGGVNIAPLFNRLQPNAIKFQGSGISRENNLRWIGNERGVAAKDCYSTISLDSQSDGTVEDKSLGSGSADGNRWAPAECDFPNRRRQWFYYDNEEKLVLPVKELVKAYDLSVGRNCNMLVGMVIDKNGLVPDKDRRVFEEFGEYMKNRFATVIATESGAKKYFNIELGGKETREIVLEEDLTNGHTVNGFEVYVTRPVWGRKRVYSAKVIGNKRIIKIAKKKVMNIEIVITDTLQDLAEIKVSVY